MGRLRERWGCIRGDGLGAGAMERNLGRWAGHGSDGEVLRTMGRAWERWGGILGDGQGAGAMGRYWQGAGAIRTMGRARERWGGTLDDGQGA